MRKKVKLSSDAELQELQQLPNFPPSSNRIPFGSWVATAVWSEAAIDKWAEGQRAMAAKISRLLG